MSEGLTLPAPVLAAKAALLKGQQKLRQQHDQGSPGIQVCAKLTDLADTSIKELFASAISDLAMLDGSAFKNLSEQVALVAHGGYGRRELAPYSDIDLMILHTTGISSHIAVLAERMMRDICDAGLILGLSVRTSRQAVSLACKDPRILTSLTESRHLAGNEEITDRFLLRLKRATVRRARSLLPAIDKVRRAERRDYGETVFLLEPNIKRSRGGLRDIQLVRWIGFCLYGTTDLNGLYLKGVLEKEDQKILRSATEFLLRIRNEVHFHARKAYDQLDRDEQVRLAERFGYQGMEGMMPVEHFMQDYFRHTRAVRYISARFLANAYRSSKVAGFFSVLFSHQVEEDFRVGPNMISATKRGMKRIRSDLSEVLRLAELATLYDKRITHDT
ncbi:MAG TPA: [protein-PII] uridylyltransferase, partial [Pirellulales bacterium]|nr:[protein-PII] uridylyltransferase [Pirellulales bacterium]